MTGQARGVSGPRRITALFAAVVAIVAAASCSSDDAAPTDGKRTVHEAFSMTLEELESAIGGLPADIRENIEARPWYFLELTDRMLTQPEELYVLVDKSHSLDPDTLPPDLVPLTNYDLSLNRSDLSLRRSVMPDVLAMTEAARIDGVELVYSSTYRSYDYQKSVYERHVREYGREQADRVSARPGTSQHQLGTTIDFGSITDAFRDTEAGRWLFDNAWRFGFSLSYPEGGEDLTGYRHEIWHYRYLSRTGTTMEREFFSSLQQHFLAFFHENRELFESSRVGTVPDERAQ